MTRDGASLDASLAGLSLFGDLGGDQRAQVLRHARRIRLPANDTLFTQGAPGEAFYILLSGRLKVTQVTADGRQLIVRIVHPDELCGFVKAIGRETYPATASAITEVDLIAWPVSEWDAVLSLTPSLALGAIRAIGRKLDEAHTRLREMTTQEAERRMAHTVLRLAEEAGETRSGTTQIAFPFSRQDVADMTGSTLHTTSRIMAAWEAQGILVRARRKIVIADMAALRCIADAGEQG